jgi:glycosyltransferase involved in cell wall biosynthesis
MRLALVVPGGVDASGEYRIIPALLALIRQLTSRHEVCVFALHQQPQPGRWTLCGAQVVNIGAVRPRLRCVRAIMAEHRVRPFDALQAIWSGSPGAIAVTAGRLLGVPSLVHVAGGEPVALRAISYGGQLTWKGRLREAAVLRAAAGVTVSSGPMLSALARLGITARCVPLGVDLQAWPPRRPVRRHGCSAAQLIHVASLNRVKDQPTLLRALVSLRERGLSFEMHIVGEDTLAGETQALSERLGLAGCTTFHGFLPQRALRPLVEGSDLLLISSLHEAGPLVLREAAAAGVPAVGTAVGEIADWAPQAALAAPVGDSQALAAAAARLLEDEALRLQLAHAAWTRATQECAGYTARAFEALYMELIEGRRGRRAYGREET